MLSAGILVLSIVLQVAAATMALRLIRVTGWRVAWIAVAGALALMTARRCITLYRLVADDFSHPPDLAAELVALVISALMLVGVLAIAPIFKTARGARAELRDSEARFSDIIHGFGGRVWEADAEHRFTYISSQLSGGLSAERLIGMHRQDIPGVFAADAGWDTYRADVAARRPIRDFRYRWRKDDGSIQWLAVRGKPIIDETGTFRGYRGTSANVTAEVEAQQRAATVYERMAVAVEGLSETFRLFDAEDRLVIANPAWRKLNSAIADQVKPGMTFEEIIRLQVDVGHFPEAEDHEEAWIRARVEQHRNPGEPFEVGRQDSKWLFVNEHKLSDGGTLIIASDITEMKQAGIAVKESEERFKDFAESAGDWFWETDSQHRFTRFVGQDSMVTNNPVERSIGKTRFDMRMAHDADDENWDAHQATLGAHEPFRNFLFPYADDAGVTNYVRASGRPIFSDDGEFLGYRGSSSNVTAEVEAERAAAAASERLAVAVEGLSETLLLFDADDRLVLTNQAWRDGNRDIADRVKPGMLFEDIMKLQVAGDSLKDIKGREEAWLRERIEYHRDPSGPIELSAKDGRTLLVVDRKLSDGGSVTTGSDITDIRRAEKAARDGEARLRAMVENAAVGIAEVGPDGRYRRLNAKFCEIAGYSHDELLRLTHTDITHPDDREADLAFVQTIVDGKTRSFTEEKRYVQKNGAVVWVNLSVTGVRDEAGEHMYYIAVVQDITERKQAEQRATAAHDRLVDAVESLDEGFALLDADDRLVLVNESFREQYGPLAHLYVPGTHFRDIAQGVAESGLVPEAVGRVDEWVRERTAQHRNPAGRVERQLGDQWLMIGEHKTSDGGTVVVSADITELKTRELEIREINRDLEQRVEERTGALTRELKERERMEAALRASEERLRAVLDTTIDGIIVIDETGIVESFNSSAAQIFGYTADEVIGHNIRMLMPEPDRGSHDGYLETYLSTGEAKIIGVGREVVGRRKDGSEFPLDLGISEANLGDRRVFTGIVRDITERHQAREALEASEERLRRALRDAPFAVLMHAEDGEILLVNKRWTERSGYTLDDISTIDAWTEKAYGPKREELRDFIKHLYELTEPLHQGEYEIIVASGEKRMWDFRTSPLGRLPDGRRFVITMTTDVTERNRAARELLAAKEEADDASRAKSEFLSRMSHELRTPMNAVLGFGQLLEADPDEPLTDNQEKSVKQILKSGEHLLELINEVLDLVTVETGKVALSIESLDPRDTIVSCLDITQTLADKRAIDLIDRSTPRDLPRVLADPTRFRQVLLNLLSNAVKYNREGGSVTVDCGEAEDGMVRLSVSDTGAGIPPEKTGELFQPFSRFNLDRQEIEGTGIGLTISKQLVELMDGRIGFESRPGQGSTFWLELPADLTGVPPAEPDEPRAPSAPETLPGIAKVLYVEDDPANIRLMEQIMRRFAGITLISAHNASLALALVESARPDVIVLDINLPGMNGIEALDRLQRVETTRHIPVIALSANALPGDIKRGLEVGFRHYLTKPINIPKFIDALRECAPATEAVDKI